MRVVDIDPAKTKICPGAHHYIAAPKPMCTRPGGPGCYSAYFSTHRVPYTEVRGFAHGYQVRRKRDWKTQGKVFDTKRYRKNTRYTNVGQFLVT